MAHVLLGDTLKCSVVCLFVGDGFVTIMEFEANLNPKTRKKIEEKLDAGWKFDKDAWDASAERHKDDE